MTTDLEKLGTLRALAKEPHWRPDVWKAFAEELGILGAPFSEDLGGERGH